jgi:hypothetical protein
MDAPFRVIDKSSGGWSPGNLISTSASPPLTMSGRLETTAIVSEEGA